MVIECKRVLLYMTTTWHFLLSFVLNSISSLESSGVPLHLSLSIFVLSPVDFMTSLGGGGHQLVQLKLALGRVENPNQVRGRIAELLATDPGHWSSSSECFISACDETCIHSVWRAIKSTYSWNTVWYSHAKQEKVAPIQVKCVLVLVHY